MGMGRLVFYDQYADISCASKDADRHLEVLVGEAGPGRGGLGAQVGNALNDVGGVVVLLSGAVVHIEPTDSVS